eukprot:scaffold116292_cov29-Tisochrysis_lutea.AAC.5
MAGSRSCGWRQSGHEARPAAEHFAAHSEHSWCEHDKPTGRHIFSKQIGHGSEEMSKGILVLAGCGFCFAGMPTLAGDSDASNARSFVCAVPSTMALKSTSVSTFARAILWVMHSAPGSQDGHGVLAVARRVRERNNETVTSWGTY